MSRFRMRGAGEGRSGFSLVEVALALGIVAFAIVGIVGMMPVALDAARESRVETRAAQIARSVVSDLRASEFGAARVQTGANVTEHLTANLSAASDLYLRYSGNGAAAGASSPEEYRDGYRGPDTRVEFLARLRIAPVSGANLTRLDLSVEAPAAAPGANRRRHTFVTMEAAR